MTAMQELKERLNQIGFEGIDDFINPFLEKEKNQLIQFGYLQIENIDCEIGNLIYKKIPEEIYSENFEL